MGFKNYIKQEFAKDPLFRLGKRFFGPRAMSPKNEGEWYYKQAIRCINYKSRKFDISLAVNYLKKAIRLTPWNADYHCTLGQALLLAPSFATIHRVDLNFSLSRSAELAIKEFEKAIRCNSNHSWAYYCMALAYDYMGQKERAKENCRTALNLSPPQDVKNLTENYLKLLEAPPLDNKTISELKEKSLSQLTQAVIHRREGKQHLAVKEFEQGCQLAPDSAWLYRTLCQMGSASLKASVETDDFQEHI